MGSDYFHIKSYIDGLKRLADDWKYTYICQIEIMPVKSGFSSQIDG